MKVVTLELQDNIKSIMLKLDELKEESLDLYNLYWKGTVNTDNPGGANPATTVASGSLEGNDITGLVNLAENLDKFFKNVAVATSDYLSTIEKVTHGDNAVGTAISSDIEDFGARGVILCTDLLDCYQKARQADNFYINSEISAAAGAMSTQTVMFGAAMTKDDITSAITLLREFIKMLENTAVTTGDYRATLAKWERL
jgi:hypothetical protein